MTVRTGNVGFCCCRYVIVNWVKVAEAVFVAACSAVILMLLIYVVPDCRPIEGFRLPNNTEQTINSSVQHTLHRRSVPGRSDDLSVNNTSETEHQDPYGYHGEHGYVFKAGNICCWHVKLKGPAIQN